MRTSHALASFILTGLLGGCTLSISAVRPDPTVDLPASRTSLALAFGPRVRDRFAISIQRGVFTIEVDSFHQTLASGFQAMVRASFAPATPDGADATLLLDDASVEEVPGYRTVSFVVRYRARVVDRAGRVLRRSFGSVESRGGLTWTNEGPGSPSSLLGSTIAAMFEKIAADCFVNPLLRLDAPEDGS